MILTERIKVYSKKSDVYSDLDKLCFQSKNIFNSTLYAIKRAFINKEKIPSYNDLDRLWRNDNNIDYRRSSLQSVFTTDYEMRICSVKKFLLTDKVI